MLTTGRSMLSPSAFEPEPPQHGYTITKGEELRL
jgi:hypothetical protein